MNSEWAIGIIVGLMIGVCAGICIGGYVGESEANEKAIKAGAAVWSVNPQTGETALKYLPPLKKE